MQDIRSHRTVVAIVISLLSLLLVAGVAEAREAQLAGIRLGQHAVNLLDIYGQPRGIVTGQGEAFAGGGAAAGGEMGMMGMEGEMGMMEGEMGMPMEEPGMVEPGMGGPGEFPEDEMAMEGGPEGAAGAAAAGAGGVQANPYPLWALPVWVDLESNQVQWLYTVGPVVLGFVLDRDGYIESIAVAGEKCDFARSSMWQPHQYVKLGDSYKHVIYRYGWPDETITYYSTGPGEVGTGGGPISVTWNGMTREFTRDCILQYDVNNNINFTFHNMKVVRMHIWTHE
ncbi:MAG: hypothetical protein R6V07_04285 [Armatimonadota bacterium]